MAHATMMGNGIPAKWTGGKEKNTLEFFHPPPWLRSWNTSAGISCRKYEILLYLHFFFGSEVPGACQALSDAIVAAGPWSTQAGQDLSLCHSVRDWSSGQRDHSDAWRSSGLLTYDEGDKRLHLRVEGTEQCRQSPASCVTTRRLASLDTFHLVGIKMLSGGCRTSSQSALS